ncbi:hypothetical protein BpHYR1_003002 [Brachionus plicatilis]|uniref:Endonuclease/exonuclease/phosphatase domain-containing protein n=1 Tax=Brachionus plicatilis TaxID=10195 RepID=A0A3M7RIV2_BRAPC|nr:hypothetical protein BpHYR1_003002 [Brachionus plicatilis]
MLLRNSYFFYISFYNPPDIELPFDFFLDISRKCGKFIMGGDLNAKTNSLSISSENENDLILEKIINQLNLSTDYYEMSMQLQQFGHTSMIYLSLLVSKIVIRKN